MIDMKGMLMIEQDSNDFPCGSVEDEWPKSGVNDNDIEHRNHADETLGSVNQENIEEDEEK